MYHSSVAAVSRITDSAGKLTSPTIDSLGGTDKLREKLHSRENKPPQVLRSQGREAPWVSLSASIVLINYVALLSSTGDYSIRMMTRKQGSTTTTPRAANQRAIFMKRHKNP